MTATTIMTIEEVKALPALDAEAYHALVCNRILGCKETYTEVNLRDGSDWPDFEGGAETIAKAAGLEVVYQSNDSQDEDHTQGQLLKRAMTNVFERGLDLNNFDSARDFPQLWEVVRDYPEIIGIQFVDEDTFGEQVYDMYYCIVQVTLPALIAHVEATYKAWLEGDILKLVRDHMVNEDITINELGEVRLEETAQTLGRILVGEEEVTEHLRTLALDNGAKWNGVDSPELYDSPGELREGLSYLESGIWYQRY